VHRLLTDPTLREDLRVRGLRRAGTLTWQHTARRTLEVYEQVLGARRERPAARPRG
jgi:hypothetical protein